MFLQAKHRRPGIVVEVSLSLVVLAGFAVWCVSDHPFKSFIFALLMLSAVTVRDVGFGGHVKSWRYVSISLVIFAFVANMLFWAPA